MLTGCFYRMTVNKFICIELHNVPRKIKKDQDLIFNDDFSIRKGHYFVFLKVCYVITYYTEKFEILCNKSFRYLSLIRSATYGKHVQI